MRSVSLKSAPPPLANAKFVLDVEKLTVFGGTGNIGGVTIGIVAVPDSFKCDPPIKNWPNGLTLSLLSVNRGPNRKLWYLSLPFVSIVQGVVAPHTIGGAGKAK